MATADLPLTPETYHGDFSRISATGIKTFMGSRREFEGYYITRTQPRPKPTASMGIGSLTHADLLGEGDVNRFVQSPFDSFRTKAAREWRDEQEASGRIVVNEQQLTEVMACYDSVRAKVGRWLDMPGVSESVIEWEDSETGMACKMMADRIVESPTGPVVLDIKTAADVSPEGFRKAIENQLYAIQQVHYELGVEERYGVRPMFLFVAVQNKWPNTSRVYQIDGGTLRKASAARLNAMTAIADCLETGDWSEPGERDVITIECRDWHLSKESEA